MSSHQDPYYELASSRANTQASVAFQALQSGLLVQMNHSMNGIHAEMEMVRQQQNEALAIHQELLNREQMQSHLEEFIYQAEKLVAECSKSTTDIPASSRYFLLVGVLGKIKSDGIGTSIIKGRENKVAFEKVIQDTQGLTLRLKKEPEVQEAIKWAEEERQRREAKQERAEQERQQERQHSVVKLKQKLAALRSQLDDIKPVKAMEVFHEYWAKAKAYLDDKMSDGLTKTIVLVVGCVLAFFLSFYGLGFLIACTISANNRNAANKNDVLKEITKVNRQIADLIVESEE